MTTAVLTRRWEHNPEPTSKDQLTIQHSRIYDDAVWLVFSPLKFAAGPLRFNINDIASMSNFIDEIKQSVLEQYGSEMSLATVEAGLRDVFRLGLLRADKNGRVIMSRLGYRYLGHKPPFWLRK